MGFEVVVVDSGSSVEVNSGLPVVIYSGPQVDVVVLSPEVDVVDMGPEFVVSESGLQVKVVVSISEVVVVG
jgi:hypothetical protein